MKIVDASAVVSALTDGGDPGERARTKLTGSLVAPHLIDIEVVSAMRGFVRRGAFGASQAQSTLADFLRLRLTRAPHRQLLPRIWELRDNLSAYDSTYVALAEVWGAPLLTADRRLASAPGVRCEIQLLS